MAVDLTISETLDGAAIADTINSGNLGMGLGNVSNGKYTPVTDQDANTGYKNIYISHNGVNFIEQIGVYITKQGEITGYAYGGAVSAVADYAQITAAGAASQASKNNADGLSGGLWMETRAFASVAVQFDRAGYPASVKTFGLAGQGISGPTYFLIPVDSMVYNAPPETAATSPVAGKIGPAGNTVLGDAAHLKFRFYAPNVFAGSGIIQWNTAFTYGLTS